jgi:DNA invertase Pin-like site-specific DNA recombinase
MPMTPGMAPRVIGYIRVSTDEQADSGLSLEAQRDRLRLACDFKGWTLVDVIADEGITGTSVAKRRGLRRALKAIAAHRADGLMCTKLDRLSRSSADTALIFEWFKTAGATLCVLDIDVDTTSPVGAAVVTIMAAVAQLERDQTAERTRAALAVKRQGGKATGRPGVHENPPLLHRIRRMRHTGGVGATPMTYQEIADTLNAEGVPTIRGGKLWRVSSVQSACGYQRPPQRKEATRLPRVAGRR